MKKLFIWTLFVVFSIGIYAQQKPSNIFSDDGGFLIPYDMRDKKFFEVTWPGTHNSNSNNREGGLEKQYNYDYTARDMIKDLYNSDPVALIKDVNSAIEVVNDAISTLNKIPGINVNKINKFDTESFSSDVSTLNQELSVQQQLRNGIRFLSLDLLRREDNNKVYFSHGSTDLGRSQLQPLLEDIREFLDQKPGQVVIVGFDMLVDKRLDIQNDLNVLLKAPNVLKGSAKDLTEFKFENAYKRIVDEIFKCQNAVNHIQSELSEMQQNTDPENSEKYQVMQQFYQACKNVDLWKYVEQGDALNPEMNNSIPAMRNAFDDTAWRSLKEMVESNKRLIFLMDFIDTKYPSTTNNYKQKRNGKKLSDSTHWTDYDPQYALIDSPQKAGVPLSSFTLYANPNPGAYGSGDRSAVKPLNEAITLFLSGENIVNTLNAMDKKPHFTYYQVHFFEPGHNQPDPLREGFTVVDAANRINFQKFGYPWKKANVGRCYWNAKIIHEKNLKAIHDISSPKRVEMTAKDLRTTKELFLPNVVNYSPYDYSAIFLNSPQSKADVIEFAVKNGQPIKLRAIANITLTHTGQNKGITLRASKDGKTWKHIFTGGGQGPLWKYSKINTSEEYLYFRIAITANQRFTYFHAFHFFE